MNTERVHALMRDLRLQIPEAPGASSAGVCIECQVHFALRPGAICRHCLTRSLEAEVGIAATYYVSALLTMQQARQKIEEALDAAASGD